MDLFSLVASLSLDTSGYESGIKAASGMFSGLANLASKKIDLAVNFLVDFGKDTLNTGMEFDKQMSAVGAVLGDAESTVENMNRLTSFALDQARDSIFTTQQTAEAYYYMGMAGWKTEQMLAGLPAIMGLAAASGEDLANVSDIVTDSLTAFGLTAEDAVEYADILAQTATNANTDVKRMGDTFKYVAPIAGALGYDVKDVALSIGLMANAGIKGSQAGTALRNIFTRISTNAGATSKDLGALDIVTEMLGVDFYDASNNVRPWIDVLTEMRAAWHGMDEASKGEIYSAFGEEAMNNFSEAAKRAIELQDLLDHTSKKEVDIREEYEAELKDLYESNKAIFDALGIGNDGLVNIGIAFNRAKMMFGEMSDQQKLYYSKQIGSQRSMAGFLRLVEATDEEFQNLKGSLDEADGAAQKMARRRLDNLAGDVEMFESAVNSMQQTLFGKVKGPLRELVQWGTGAIKELDDAFKAGGLEGGFDKLNEILKDGTGALKPILETLGTIGGTIVGGIIESIPELDNTLVGLGHSFGSGLAGGISETLADSSPFFSSVMGLVSSWFGTDMSHGTGALTSNNIGVLKEVQAETLTINGVEVNAQDVQDAINNAESIGGQYIVTIGGEKMDISVAEQLLRELGGIGTDAGQVMGENIGAKLDTAAATDWKPDIATTIGQAGAPAANKFANGFQGQLDKKTFGINVHANVSGLPTQHNASAMDTGRIFRRPTLFGYANGAYQIAGDAGPEAVVGTNSLFGMINGAVSSAMASRPVASQTGGRDITIIMEYDSIEFGRAVYHANQEETQRVGVKLTRI